MNNDLKFVRIIIPKWINSQNELWINSQNELGTNSQIELRINSDNNSLLRTLILIDWHEKD